jgi:ATP-binding cassette subfamily C protein CydCD
VCIGLGVLAAVLVVAQAELLSRGIAGAVQGGQGVTEVRAVLLGLALVVAGRVLVALVQDGAAQRAAASVKSQLRREVVHRSALLGAGHEGPLRRSAVATLATRGLDSLDSYFGRYLPQLALAVAVPAVVLARLVPADLTAALTVLATLPLIPVFMALIGKATEAATARRWHALTRLGHHFLDVVAGLPTLKVFGRAKAQAEAVRSTTDDYRTTTLATLRIAFLSSLVLELLATLSVALVAVGVGLRLVHGSLDLRTGLLVIILAPEAYLPLRQLGALHHASADGLAAVARAFAVIDTPSPVPGTIVDVPDLRDGELRVEGVRVHHAGRAAPAPDGASFTARPGELLVVTGPSGAGKTTLVRAILGFVVPDEGRVVAADRERAIPLPMLDAAAWRRHVAWLDQVPYLFSGTVADNVRLADATAGDQQVRAALARSGLAGVGPGRAVGEQGAGLSAGERRRVGLARALLRDTALLVCDEPTAGLDPRTEAEVLAVLRAAARDRVVVVVSHRPAVIAAADRVVELPFPAGSPVHGDAVGGAASWTPESGRREVLR